MHYLIESYSGYKAAKMSLKGQKVIWHTTAPYLLELLPSEGEEVYSLEEEVDQKTTDQLARLGYEICESLAQLLNDSCPWRGYVDFKTVLYTFTTQFFLATFYKGFLLNKLMLDPAFKEADLYCVGDPTKAYEVGMNPNYGRVDTVFSFIANYCSLSNVKVFEHRISQKKIDAINKGIIKSEMQLIEKCLSLANNTLSSFCCKIWKFINRKKIYPFQHIGLWPYPCKNIYYYKHCELTDELFISLLLRGAHVGQLPSMPTEKYYEATYGNNDFAKYFLQACSNLITRKFTQKGLPFTPISKACVELFSRRILGAIEQIQGNFDKLTDDFNNITSSLRPNRSILTVELSTPIERMFYCYCKKEGVKVVAAEHGITCGLSKWGQWWSRLSGMVSADIGLYHNQISAQALEPFSTNQKAIVIGLAEVTRKVMLKPLQRILAKKLLNIKSSEKIIVYVADLEKNNEVRGPHDEKDWQYLKKTKGIIKYLAKKYPEDKIIVKLYPSQRYYDEYTFGNITSKFKNVKTVKNMDFRFIRSLADKIYVSSYLSTLGWVLGANVEYHFLEFKWSPTVMKTTEQINQSYNIYGLRDMRVFDKKELLTSLSKDKIAEIF